MVNNKLATRIIKSLFSTNIVILLADHFDMNIILYYTTL